MPTPVPTELQPGDSVRGTLYRLSDGSYSFSADTVEMGEYLIGREYKLRDVPRPPVPAPGATLEVTAQCRAACLRPGEKSHADANS